jgi:hypothetical protein
MQMINYPSRSFIDEFNAALETRDAFSVVATNPRKRAAIVRTIKRLYGQPVDDRFVVSLADKVFLWDFYPCLADALLGRRYEIHQEEREDRLIVTFQP